jgi:Tol biopolymer transport system component
VGLVGSRAASSRPVTLPAGPLLSFSGIDGSLAIAAENGTSTIRLALYRRAFVTAHSWSSDGRRIAFTRCARGRAADCAVYLIDADGTNQRRLLPSAGAAVWLPDGKHLLVTGADRPGHRPGHWLVSVASGERRTFTAPGLAAAPFQPSLSPDGRWLLHLAPLYGRLLPSPSAPHHARARNWLIITDLRSGRSRRVRQERGLYHIGTAPWSPDGTAFTFTWRRFLQAPGGRIYIARPTIAESQLVTTGARLGGAWSPDALRLAFNTGGSCEIRVVTIDGSAPARTLPFRGCAPTWRPMR